MHGDVGLFAANARGYWWIHLDGKLANEHTRQQRADDISELKRPKAQASQQESEGKCQEYCQLRVLS